MGAVDRVRALWGTEGFVSRRTLFLSCLLAAVGGLTFLLAYSVYLPITPAPEETPPAPEETPPEETPLEETPPVETPPEETPPVGTPPVGTPPVGTPPIGTPPVTLLVWAHPFGRRRELPDCRALLQIEGCELTDDRGRYREVEAVIFHHRDVLGRTALPQQPRPEGQKWIWMNHESPSNSYRLGGFEGVYNFTISYRKDSDVFLPYGYLVQIKNGTPPDPSVLPLLAPSGSELIRPRLLAWVVSNWSNSHARVAFYRELSKYIKVDLYGHAGQRVPNDTGRDSVVRMLGQYQFYLSLENSQHTDYVTEKLWNAIRAGAIPVVLGPSRKNYERFLPPQAFIHEKDFPSPKDLAQYLQSLSTDEAGLRRHLDWRDGHGLHLVDFPVEHYCRGCRLVMENRGRTNVVKDLEEWFRSSREAGPSFFTAIHLSIHLSVFLSIYLSLCVCIYICTDGWMDR